MSKANTGRRIRNIYKPDSTEPFRLSRARIEDFLKCPRCFYLDRRLGVSRPSTPPFSLNNAVDSLFKKEFDYYRARREPHPLFRIHHIDAVPYQHEKMDHWREALRGGIEYDLPGTNIRVAGGVDDVWENSRGELIIADYKATAKEGPVGIDAEWQISYKRQMEIYQWLFRKNGFKVSNTGYFVYCNGRLSEPKFDQALQFDVALIPYDGNDNWVEDAVRRAHECLSANHIPMLTKGCEFCMYYMGVQEATRQANS